MIHAYYTLIAALVGGSLTLAGQFLSSRLAEKRERNKIKRELVAEERCLSYLLTEYHNLFIEETITAQFYTKMAALSFQKDNTIDNDILYKSGNEALDRAEQLEEKIRLTTANYFKTITLFTNLTGKREPIINSFEKLQAFQKPSSKNISDADTIQQLEDQREKTTLQFRELYKFFPNTYNTIFEEMRKSV